MKKMILFLAILFAGTVVIKAQGGFQRRTVEERVATAHQKLDSTLKLEKTKLSQTDSVFTDFYKATDKVRDEMMSGGGQSDFQAMREKMQPFVDERDKKLQAILTEEQFKIFKDQIEPTLRPRRPGGGNNR